MDAYGGRVKVKLPVNVSVFGKSYEAIEYRIYDAKKPERLSRLVHMVEGIGAVRLEYFEVYGDESYSYRYQLKQFKAGE